MKKFFKIFAALLAFLTMTALYSGNTAMAKREGNTTNVHITKLKSDSTPKAIKHDGTQITDLSTLKDSLGVTVTPLAGVEFTYYKVPDQATLDKMLAAPASYTTEAEIKALIPDAIGTKTGLTAENTGLVTVQNLADGLYWFIESAKPETVSSAVAVPFGMSLPMTTSDGKEEMADVYIYPKNVESNLPEVDKTVGNLTGKNDSYDIGKEFKWYLQSTVPTNIKDYTKLEFSDTLDTKLDYVGNVVVKYGDDVIPDSNYTITTPTETDRTFKVTFNTVTDEGDNKGKLVYFTTLDQATIDAKKDKKLVVEFTSKINKTAVMGTKIENNFDLNFRNNPTLDKDQKKTPVTPPTVVTGGKKFIKIDATDANKKALEGAEFVVQNTVAGKTTYLKVDDTTGAVTWVETQAEATTFKTSADGIVDVKGLAFTEAQQGDTKVTNSYALLETKAPAGYGIIVEPLKFTVDDKSYGDTEGVRMEVPNKKLTIPQTGGIGTIIFAVVGVTLMAGAVIFMKRREA